MKHYYAILHTNFSLDDSDEKIKEWDTATVYRFNDMESRDAFVRNNAYAYRITAKRANYIGWRDFDED